MNHLYIVSYFWFSSERGKGLKPYTIPETDIEKVILNLYTLLFCWPGRTTTSDSLFFYTPGTSWSSYNDPTFTPLFLDQLIASTANDDPAFLQESRDMCGTDNQCLFDALATKSLTRGVDTKVQSEENVAEARSLGMFSVFFITFFANLLR